jgi:hypothetical protein
MVALGKALPPAVSEQLEQGQLAAFGFIAVRFVMQYTLWCNRF